MVKFPSAHKQREDPVAGPNHDWAESLLSLLELGLLIIDEIHEYRNIGILWHVLRDLRKRSWNVLGLSATPVMNTPMVRSIHALSLSDADAQHVTQDLVNVGQILGLSRFDDLEATNKFRRAFNRARTHLRKEQEKYILAARELARGRNVDELVENELRDAVRNWMDDIRAAYRGVVIRRTPDSKDCDGNVIIGLAPAWEVVVYLQLNKEERHAILRLARRLGRNNAERTYQVRDCGRRRGSELIARRGDEVAPPRCEPPFRSARLARAEARRGRPPPAPPRASIPTCMR